MKADCRTILLLFEKNCPSSVALFSRIDRGLLPWEFAKGPDMFGFFVSSLVLNPVVSRFDSPLREIAVHLEMYDLH